MGVLRSKGGDAAEEQAEAEPDQQRRFVVSTKAGYSRPDPEPDQRGRDDVKHRQAGRIEPAPVARPDEHLKRAAELFNKRAGKADGSDASAPKRSRTYEPWNALTSRSRVVKVARAFEVERSERRVGDQKREAKGQNVPTPDPSAIQRRATAARRRWHHAGGVVDMLNTPVTVPAAIANDHSPIRRGSRARLCRTRPPPRAAVPVLPPTPTAAS